MSLIRSTYLISRVNKKYQHKSFKSMVDAYKSNRNFFTLYKLKKEGRYLEFYA